jgi:hypothetical protein
MSQLLKLGWGLVKIIIGAMLRSIFSSQGVLNKAPIIYLDGMPPLISLIMSSTNS